MNCSSCNQELDSQKSGFILCPNCKTVNISKKNEPDVNNTYENPRHFKTSLKILTFKKPKIAFSILACLLIVTISGMVMGIQNYQASSKLSAAKESIAKADFELAKDLLESADKYFSFGSTKKNIRETQSQNNRWLDFNSKLYQGTNLVQQKNYKPAKIILAQIESDFPLYSKVTELLARIALEQKAAEHVNKPAQTKPKQKATAPVVPRSSTGGPCYQIGGINTRSSTDRPDDSNGYQVHIVYALPSDRDDKKHDTNGTLARSVSAWQNWLCGQTGGKTLRMDTYKGKLDVSFIRFKDSDNVIKTGSTLPYTTNPNSNPYVREDIEIRLKKLGFNNSKKIYAVYYGGTSNYSCGGGAWPPTLIGHVAAMYMRGGKADWPVKCEHNTLTSSIYSPQYFEFGILHEIMHTLGFAPACAPHEVSAGHVSDGPKDLMYSGNKPWDPSLLDINHNDYYKSGRSGCIDFNQSVFLTNGGNQLPPGW